MRLRVDGDALRLDAPRGALASEELERVRAAKADIIRLLAERDGRASGPQRIGRVDRSAPIRLGLVQHRMWLLDQLDPGTTVNNLPGAWRLTGQLDHSALERALQEVVRRHEVLRTRIVVHGGEPRQLIDADWRPLLPRLDLRALPEPERTEAMMRRIREERDAPFDLARLPLFRAQLFRLAEREHVLFMVAHHVIWDGWSWDVLHDELSALYGAFRAGAPSPLPELPMQYADYAAWHRDLMSGPELDRQLGYWRTRLGGDLPVLALPTDRPRSAVPAREGGRRVLEIDRELLASLWRIGRSEDATLFMVLLTAYAAWLMRWAGQDEVTIGVPAQDRLRDGADKLIGTFVNTLVVRVRLEEGTTFRDLLRQVRDACIEAYDHQDVPFDRLVDELGVERRPGYTPIYQTLFTFQDIRNRPSRIGDLELSQVHVDTGIAPTDMLFGCMVGREHAVALLDFRADLFEPDTMTRMAASFRAALYHAARDPERIIARLSLVDADGRDTEAARFDLFETTTRPATVTENAVSSAQEAMWFVERTAPGSPVHHLAERFRVRGSVDTAALQAALDAVVARHETLRVCFDDDGGRPVVREVALRPALRVVDGIPHAQLAELLDAEARVPFDLRRGPLVRCTLARAATDEHVLQLTCHQIIADERSLAVMLEDLGRAYRAVRAGAHWNPDAAENFAAYAHAERAAAVGATAERALDYWMERLATLPPPLDIADQSRPPALSLAAGSVALELPAGLSDRIEQLATSIGSEPAAVFAAALRIVLRRHGAAAGIGIGVPVSLRPEGTAWDRTVGAFLNPVLLLDEPGEDADARSAVAAVGRELAAARQHGFVPFATVVEQVRPPRSTNRAPLFQVLLSVEARPGPHVELEGASTERVFTEQPGLATDLAVYLHRDPAGWRGRVDYARDLFRPDRAARIAEHLGAAIEALVLRPEATVGEVEVLPPRERSALLERGCGSELSLEDRHVLEAIERHARAHPERVALTQAGRSVTYGALWTEVEALSCGLLQRGVGPGAVVGVCMQRAPELLVALLGVLRAGAAYLPIDRDFPAARIAFMLADAQAQGVIADETSRGALPDAVREVWDYRALVAGRSEAPLSVIGGSELAYLIYTSGSTGTPKGVEVEHRSLLNLIASMAGTPGIRPDDVLLAVTTPSFDIAALELFIPLWTGATLALADEDEVRDGERLARALERERATWMQATPSTWRMLLEAGWTGRLRTILCGGESFPSDLVAPLLERAAQVWNVYGPTETTIWSSAGRVDEPRGGAVPIGRPIANTRACVVDPAGRLCPDGVPGELWIGGLGVARGYRNRPELTAARFVADPFAGADDGRARLYRTGDLVRWNADGMLEHLGRLDEQIKVNGHRIEPGEIEAALLAHEDVRQAVVSLCRANDGGARLVAFVVLETGRTLLASEIRRFLGRRLPEYMVPGIIVEIDRVPLTPNGKADRKALPNPLEGRAERVYVAPVQERHRAVAEVWRELLGREQVGLHDNFFEIGGHSLLSIRAVALIEERTGLRIDPRTMFFQTLEQVVEQAEIVRAREMAAVPA